MTFLKDTIRQTGRSPLFHVSWSEAKLAELRIEGARQIQLAARQRQAQFDLHLSWPGLLDLITDPVIISHHAEVLGDSFQLVETRLYPKPPHSGPSWHIDSYQLLYYKPCILDGTSDDFHSVTTWLALADVPREMGPLQFIHYKHVDVRRLVRMQRNQPYRQVEEVCRLEAERLHDHIETLPMKAGDFCIFDPRNLHTGATNSTNEFRLGLVIRFCASHVRVDPKFSKTGKLEILQIRNGRVSGPIDSTLARSYHPRRQPRGNGEGNQKIERS